MWFIFSTPVLIRHLWQLKTVVFLHWCLICTVLLNNDPKFEGSNPASAGTIDIEGAKIDCSSSFIVPATSAAQNRLLFLFFSCGRLQY